MSLLLRLVCTLLIIIPYFTDGVLMFQKFQVHIIEIIYYHIFIKQHYLKFIDFIKFYPHSFILLLLTIKNKEFTLNIIS